MYCTVLILGPSAKLSEQISGQTVRNEFILKGVPYQLESKRHGTIVHETVIDSS